jgi:AraC-like DNA-binding protein
MSPGHAQYCAWRDLTQSSQTSDSSRSLAAEMHCWSFGGLVVMRMVLSGSPPRQVQEFGFGSFQDQWCLVLAKAGENNCHIATVPSSGMPDDRRGVAFNGASSDCIELITLLAPVGDDEIDIRRLARNCGRNASAAFLMAGFIERLVSQLPNSLNECSKHLAAMTRALIAAYVSHDDASSAQAGMPNRSVLLTRAQMIIRQNMSSPDFGPDQLCRLLAVSRSKLYRLFEESGGVVHFINSQRLSAAHHQLTDPRSGSLIQVIGNEVGFVDHSTFSRAFKRHFGYSPSQARERALYGRMNGAK